MNPREPLTEPNSNRFRVRLCDTSRKLMYWTIGWTLSILLLNIGPRFLWNELVAVSLLVTVLNIGLGVGMFFSWIEHLSSLDELQRKVHFDAMGIALGVAVTVGLPLYVLHDIHLIPFEINVAYLISLMGLTYSGCVRVGMRRYR